MYGGERRIKPRCALPVMNRLIVASPVIEQIAKVVRGTRIVSYRLADDGRCPDCGTAIPGEFERFDIRRQFGRRRIPVRLALRQAGISAS